MGGFTTAVSVTQPVEIWNYPVRSLTDKSNFGLKIENLYQGSLAASASYTPTVSGIFSVGGGSGNLYIEFFYEPSSSWVAMVGSVSGNGAVAGLANKIRFRNGGSSSVNIVVNRFG